MWYKKGYVSADIVSSSYTTIAGLFAAGQSAFSDYSTQEIKPWATMKGQASTGHTRVAIMPGRTHRPDGYVHLPHHGLIAEQGAGVGNS